MSPRQEAKLLVYLYKMLTTCLIVQLFDSWDFHHYWVKLRIRLQVHQFTGYPATIEQIFYHVNEAGLGVIV